MGLKDELVQAYNEAHEQLKSIAVKNALIEVGGKMVRGVLLDEARKGKKGMWVYSLPTSAEYHDAIVAAVGKDLGNWCDVDGLQFGVHIVNPLGICTTTAFYVEWVPDAE